MRDEDFVRTEVEFDIDTQNPKEIRVIIKSISDMNGRDVYDALHCLVHDILEPEIFGDVVDSDKH